MFCLPSHTTHEAQALDCNFFGPLKRHWRDICHTFYQHNPTKDITRLNFSRLFNQAWVLVITPANISSGFRKAGVWPFNPHAIKVPDVAGDDSATRANQSASSSCSSGVSTPLNPTALPSLSGSQSTSLTPLHSHTSDTALTTFTEQQVICFQRRVEEGL